MPIAGTVSRTYRSGFGTRALPYFDGLKEMRMTMPLMEHRQISLLARIYYVDLYVFPANG